MFSTKERRKQIPSELKERFWSYIAGICKHEGIFVHAIGGIEGHVHLLLQIPPTTALADGVREIKTNSSSWMKEFVDDFAWQQGYSGFGVSKSNIPAVVRYMKNQERHDLVRSVAWDLRRVYYRVMSESNQHVCELFARSWRII